MGGIHSQSVYNMRESLGTIQLNCDVVNIRKKENATYDVALSRMITLTLVILSWGSPILWVLNMWVARNLCSSNLPHSGQWTFWFFFVLILEWLYLTCSSRESFLQQYANWREDVHVYWGQCAWERLFYCIGINDVAKLCWLREGIIF